MRHLSGNGNTLRIAVASRALAAALAASVTVGGCGTEKMPKVDDTVAPTMQITSPRQDERIESVAPLIEISYADKASGIAVVTFNVTINGRNYSGEFDHHSYGATGQISPNRRLPLGTNRMVVEIADRNGNVGRIERTFVNASGGYLSVRGASAPQRYVELVLDASGSMQSRINGSTRMEVAKSAVESLLEVLPAKTAMGMRVFSGCDSIVQMVPVKPVDKAAFLEQVRKINPSGGTPIVASLLQSFEALRKFDDGERIVVLVTDGGESCGGNISKAVTVAKDAATRVFVIGFDIASAGISRQLRDMAESTDGAFFDARRPEELRAALHDSVLRIAYKVYDAGGQRVASGFVDGERIEVPRGTYEVRTDTVPQVIIKGVRIGRLTETGIRLRRAPDGLAFDLENPPE